MASSQKRLSELCKAPSIKDSFFFFFFLEEVLQDR